MAVFAIPPLIESSRHNDRILAIVLLATTAGGVISTQSRTALLALAAGTVVYIVLTRGIPRRTRMLVIGAVAIVGIGAWTVYGLLPDNRSFGDARTLESRQEIWTDAFTVFAQSPLLGNGFQVSTFGRFGAGNGNGQSVHNEYLGRLVDGGLVGFGLWLWVVGTFTIIAWGLWRSHGPRSAEGTSLLAFLCVLGLTMLTNAPWSSGSTPIFIWLFLGMGTGSYIAETREQPIANRAPPAAPSAGEVSSRPA
jgi:O-antigen ligase